MLIEPPIVEDADNRESLRIGGQHRAQNLRSEAGDIFQIRKGNQQGFFFCKVEQGASGSRHHLLSSDLEDGGFTRHTLKGEARPHGEQHLGIRCLDCFTNLRIGPGAENLVEGVSDRTARAILMASGAHGLVPLKNRVPATLLQQTSSPISCVSTQQYHARSISSQGFFEDLELNTSAYKEGWFWPGWRAGTLEYFLQGF